MSNQKARKSDVLHNTRFLGYSGFISDQLLEIKILQGGKAGDAGSGTTLGHVAPRHYLRTGGEFPGCSREEALWMASGMSSIVEVVESANSTSQVIFPVTWTASIFSCGEGFREIYSVYKQP